MNKVVLYENEQFRLCTESIRNFDELFQTLSAENIADNEETLKIWFREGLPHFKELCDLSTPNTPEQLAEFMALLLQKHDVKTLAIAYQFKETLLAHPEPTSLCDSIEDTIPQQLQDYRPNHHFSPRNMEGYKKQCLEINTLKEDMRTWLSETCLQHASMSI